MAPKEKEKICLGELSLYLIDENTGVGGCLLVLPIYITSAVLLFLVLTVSYTV